MNEEVEAAPLPPATAGLCVSSHIITALEELHPGFAARVQEIGLEQFWKDSTVIQLRPSRDRPLLLRRLAEACAWERALALLVDARAGWRKRQKRAG